MKKKYNFWKKYSHYELGYKPDLVEEFNNCGEAYIFCELEGYEAFDNVN